MEPDLPRQLRVLRRYAIITTTIALGAAVTAFRGATQRPRFTEIDVERINIVESDGSLRLVISNQARQHPGIMNGKVVERSGPRPPGLLFFNHLGDEMGGLIFGENGGIGHFGQLTFDKVRGDQTIGFRHLESSNGDYATALEMWQQPNTPGDVLRERYDEIQAMADTAAPRQAFDALREAGLLTTRRLFLGKGRDNAVALVLSDLQGRPRLRLSVQADGSPAIEVLDEAGRSSNLVGPD